MNGGWKAAIKMRPKIFAGLRRQLLQYLLAGLDTSQETGGASDQGDASEYKEDTVDAIYGQDISNHGSARDRGHPRPKRRPGGAQSPHAGRIKFRRVKVEYDRDRYHA